MKKTRRRIKFDRYPVTELAEEAPRRGRNGSRFWLVVGDWVYRVQVVAA